MDGNAGIGEVKPGLARSASKVAVWQLVEVFGMRARTRNGQGSMPRGECGVQGSQLAAPMQWTKFTGAVRLR